MGGAVLISAAAGRRSLNLCQDYKFYHQDFRNFLTFQEAERKCVRQPRGNAPRSRGRSNLARAKPSHTHRLICKTREDYLFYHQEGVENRCKMRGRMLYFTHLYPRAERENVFYTTNPRLPSRAHGPPERCARTSRAAEIWGRALSSSNLKRKRLGIRTSK